MRKLSGIALALLWAATGAFAGPSRVVSMNLCTDQLAMLLAAPGRVWGYAKRGRALYVGLESTF